jgi:ABC-type multidrug transport system ATPase subunit
MSADELLTLHQRLAGSGGGAAERAELLELVGLPHARATRVAAMSKGMQQRLGIAQALVGSPRLLLLDEPTSALDLGRQQQALELVHALRDGGLTILTTMHDLTLAGQYADRLVLLDRGEVVADGTPAEVLSNLNVSSYYGANVRVIHDEDGVFVLPLRR